MIPEQRYMAASGGQIWTIWTFVIWPCYVYQILNVLSILYLRYFRKLFDPNPPQIEQNDCHLDPVSESFQVPDLHPSWIFERSIWSFFTTFKKIRLEILPARPSKSLTLDVYFSSYDVAFSLCNSIYYHWEEWQNSQQWVNPFIKLCPSIDGLTNRTCKNITFWHVFAKLSLIYRSQ